MMVPVNLIPYYPYPDPAGVSLFSLEFLSAVVLVMGITAVSMAVAGKRKLWLAVWSYYVVTLIPVLGLVQVGGQAMADRYTYLPGLGPFLIAGLITAGVHGKIRPAENSAIPFRRGSIMAAFFLLVLMSYSTFLQIGLWKDGITLWNYVIEKEPLKIPRAYINAGFALMDKGRMDEALEYLQIAVRLAPDNANAHHNLGVVYTQKGRYDDAIEQFRAALRLKPDDPETHNNLGVAYRYKGMYGEAIEHHRRALRLKPDYAEAHFNLAISYLDRGETNQAKKELEAGLQLKPDDYKARQVLNEINTK
jgi:tetratricopeptide (TPR) repeat protein